MANRSAIDAIISNKATKAIKHSVVLPLVIPNYSNYFIIFEIVTLGCCYTYIDIILPNIIYSRNVFISFKPLQNLSLIQYFNSSHLLNQWCHNLKNPGGIINFCKYRNKIRNLTLSEFLVRYEAKLNKLCDAI